MLARNSPIEVNVPFVANQVIICQFSAKKSAKNIKGIGDGKDVKIGINYIVYYKKGNIRLVESGIQYINIGDIEKQYTIRFISPDGKDIYSNKNIKISKNVVYISLDSGNLNADVIINGLLAVPENEFNKMVSAGVVSTKAGVGGVGIGGTGVGIGGIGVGIGGTGVMDPIQIIQERMRKNLDMQTGITKDIVTRLKEKYKGKNEGASKTGASKTGAIDVICEGLMLGHSGFGKATRNYAYGLDKLGFNVRTIILDHDNIKSTSTTIGQRLLQISKNTNGDIGSGKDCFWITMNYPLGVKRHDFSYNIAYIMFETLDFPARFVTHLRLAGVDEIWTPSTFCKDSMERAGLKTIRGGVRVMPLGVDTNMFRPARSDKEGEGIDKDISEIVNFSSVAGKYKFLSVMGFSTRKGINTLVRAFSEEFAGKDSDKVALYLKGGWYPISKAWAEVNVARTGIPGPLPLIHLDFSAYPENILANLYRVCNAFVLPSIGEGWCMPCCEAMASGLPTIATRWSGMLEFMNEDVGYLIDVDRVGPEPTCDWITREYVGGKFGRASVKHLRQIMRDVYENREEASEKGKRAREWMVQNYSWEVSCNRMKDRLEEIVGIKKEIVKESIEENIKLPGYSIQEKGD